MPIHPPSPPAYFHRWHPHSFHPTIRSIPVLHEPFKFLQRMMHVPFCGVLSANAVLPDQRLAEAWVPTTRQRIRSRTSPPGCSREKICSVFFRVLIVTIWFYTKQALGGQTRRVNTHLDYCLQGEILLFFSIIQHTSELLEHNFYLGTACNIRKTVPL